MFVIWCNQTVLDDARVVHSLFILECEGEVTHLSDFDIAANTFDVVRTVRWSQVAELPCIEEDGLSTSA